MAEGRVAPASLRYEATWEADSSQPVVSSPQAWLVETSRPK